MGAAQTAIQVVICEDDRAQAVLLKNMLSELPEGALLHVSTCSDGAALLSALHKKAAHIIFMDINLGDENGIMLAGQINCEYPDAQIIYTTGFMKYCTDVYETEHTYFLTKPISEQSLSQALHRALERVQLENMCIRTAEGARRIPIEQIQYLESAGRKLLVHMQENTLEMYGRISEMEQELGVGFVRCHKSYLVNMDAAAEIRQKKVLLKCGTEVPISQLRYTETKRVFMNYVGMNL